MFEQEDVVERVIRQLRRPVAIDPGFDVRVLREIEQETRVEQPARRAVPLRRFWPWLAAAAVLAGLLVARPWSPSGHGQGTDLFQFVLVAPQAASVSLVGDFNDWDPARAPMSTAGGVWATVVQLTPGRYRYAFLVNGVEWRADPAAPRALDDEFGTPSSVVTVGGKRS